MTYEACSSEKAISADHSGVAQEIIDIFENSFNEHSKVIGHIGSKSYILTHGIIEGISATILSNGRGSLGLRLNLQGNGTWAVEAFTESDVAGEEITSPGLIAGLENTHFLDALRNDLQTITKEHNWLPVEEELLSFG